MINKILVVEDDTLKGRQIVNFTKSINNNIIITQKGALNSGLLELTKNEYDLVILDMSLPTFDNNESEHFQPYGGLLFLDEIKRKKYKVPIVIITQYASFGEGKGETTLEEIDLNCRNKYQNFKEIIYYLDDAWQEKLKKYIVGENND